MPLRAYIRLDPEFADRKEAYPDGPFSTLVAVLCYAEGQPYRGRFKNERILKTLLGKRARHLPYLFEHRDIVRLDDGQIYVVGWDEWQEGDWRVHERVNRIRSRRGEAATDAPMSGAQRTARWRERRRGGDVTESPSSHLDSVTTESPSSHPSASRRIAEAEAVAEAEATADSRGGGNGRFRGVAHGAEVVIATGARAERHE